jgi:predicted nucleotidyltransferase
MHPLLETHRTQLRSLAARHGLSSVRVFGSMARNDATSSSDVDLLVESKTPVSGFSLGAMLMDAQDLLGRKVDIVTIQALHPLMRERALRESVQI